MDNDGTCDFDDLSISLGRFCGIEMRVLFKDSRYHGQRQWEKPVDIYPAHLGMYCTYLRNEGHEVVWFGKDDGKFDKIVESDEQIDIEFDKLPIPDRTFTNSLNPKYLSYGNYKMSRGTHYLSSNLCWWAGERGCVFCHDSSRIIQGEPRRVRSAQHVIAEMEDCVRIGHNEAFDDAGTIPINHWLEEFCNAMIKTGLNKKIVLGCNLKPIKQNFKLMKEAGFRFILVGIESANQETIDRIQKGQHSEKVIENMKAMSEAGLEPHATSMFGYEWETHEDAMRTVKLIHYLLKKGYVKTAQASVYSPPRTQPDPNSRGHKYIPMIYQAYRSPEFWFRKISDIKKVQDFTYLLRGGRLVLEENWRKLFR